MQDTYCIQCFALFMLCSLYLTIRSNDMYSQCFSFRILRQIHVEKQRKIRTEPIWLYVLGAALMCLTLLGPLLLSFIIKKNTSKGT
jgi:hypothetical protein